MDTLPTVVGKSILRKDAREKVAGKAKYTADLRQPGMRFGAVLRSPHHHARILDIDACAARELPGVLAVITAADVRGERTFGTFIADQPPLAFERVRHMGEPVAVVVAESREIAREALKSLRVDYEVLEPVLDPVAALDAAAPQVHPGGNLCARFEVCSGDVEAAFAQADCVLEQNFTVQRVSPAYLEPENSLARWEADGTLTVWTSSQKPFGDRKEIAAVLGMLPEKVVVKNAVVGGAFGGKEDAILAVIAALAAQAAGGCVQLVNERWESFVAHPKRHPARLHYRLAARRDGTLLGLQARIHADTGAYASYGPAVASLMTELAQGPYFIPNVSVETLLAYTNSPPSGAMRGFGSPQVHFAIESLLDMLADRLGLDPLAVRQANVLRPGVQMATRVVVDETASCLERILDEAKSARERLEQIPASPGKLAGVGLALGMQSMGYGARVPDDSSHRVEWLADGRVRLHLGAPDLGQGLATIAEQVLAEALGLSPEQIETTELDTSRVPDGGVTCASRMTFLVGNAMLIGAEQLKRQLLENAAGLLQMPEEKLRYERGQVVAPDGARLPAAEFTSRLAEAGRSIQVVATASFPDPADTPTHLPVGMPHGMYVYGADVARVEVDPETGCVQVTDLVAIHDLGRVINPAAAEGQIEGGVTMGIGYTLSEEMGLKADGHWVQNFAEYLLPTAADLPARLETVLLETPESSGPYGAKGLGEVVLAPTAPAITNALYQAARVRVTDLPVSRERVMLTLAGAA